MRSVSAWTGMNSQRLDYTWNEAASGDIKQHLLHCGPEFRPMLSETVEIPEYAEKIADRAECRECWNGENLIGLAAVYMNDFDRRQAFLTNLSVDPRFGRRGVGRRLLSDAIDRAARHGFHRFRLQVYGTNRGALHLYASMGFVVEGVRDGIMDLSRRIGPR